MNTIKAFVFSYDSVKDINSKEKIPVYIRNIYIGDIELGTYVKWANNYKNKHNCSEPPLSGYLSKKITETKNIKITSQKDIIKIKNNAKNIFGTELIDVVIQFLKE